MIEQTLRKFCESRHRLLIVIAGTFIVGLVLVIPLVDVYCAERDEKSALLTELDSARSIAAALEGFEARVTQKVAELKVLEARTVNDESLPELRGKLVDLAKETSCNIRRLAVGTTSSRLWTPGEDPINPKADTKPGEAPSEFTLEWRPVSISLSGSSSSLRGLLERFAAAGMLMHVKSFEMYPSGPNRQSLTLDMEVWYFTLSRRAVSIQG
jgi:hypothetical protein